MCKVCSINRGFMLDAVIMSHHVVNLLLYYIKLLLLLLLLLVPATNTYNTYCG